MRAKNRKSSNEADFDIESVSKTKLLTTPLPHLHITKTHTDTHTHQHTYNMHIPSIQGVTKKSEKLFKHKHTDTQTHTNTHTHTHRHTTGIPKIRLCTFFFCSLRSKEHFFFVVFTSKNTSSFSSTVAHFSKNHSNISFARLVRSSSKKQNTFSSRSRSLKIAQIFLLLASLAVLENKFL